jgi:Recombinase
VQRILPPTSHRASWQPYNALMKADELRETVEALKAEGLSLNVIAARMNDQGVLTSRGIAGGWTATAVRRVLARLAA